MNKLYFTRVVEKTRGLLTSRDWEREWINFIYAGSGEDDVYLHPETEREREWMNKLYFTRVVEKTRSFYTQRERERMNG